MEIDLAGGFRLGVAGVLEGSSIVECGPSFVLQGWHSVQELIFGHEWRRTGRPFWLA